MSKKEWALVTNAFAGLVLGIILLYKSSHPAPQPLPSPLPSQQATSSGTVLGTEQDFYQGIVSRVYDGDTIEVNFGTIKKTVRYIGVDTPETVDPHRPDGCFGKEASDRNKALVSHQKVTLEKDISDTDKFGRLLRYVYLLQENGNKLFVNEFLVREGYAKVSTFPPDVKNADLFLEAERQAQQLKKGLWASCL